MAHLKKFQLTVPRTIVTSCAGIAGALSANPIPGFGSIISASAGAIATQGLGDAAIAYFLKNEANLN